MSVSVRLSRPRGLKTSFLTAGKAFFNNLDEVKLLTMVSAGRGVLEFWVRRDWRGLLEVGS